MSGFDSTFRAAVPGVSLTHKMGSLPHEKPPQFVNPNDALEYIWKLLNTKEALKQVWACLEQHNVTVWQINRALLFKLAMDGVIQLNLALVIGPQVFKMIEIIGRAKGIKPKLQPEFRSKSYDNMMDKSLNEKLGRKDNPQKIPPSAMKSTMLPPPEEISKGMTAISGKKHTGDSLLDLAKAK